jgi:hypothetical protein
VNFGSMLFVGLTALFIVGMAIGITAWALVPIVVLALGAIFAVPIAAMMKKADVGRGTEPGGVPETRDAAYKPAVDPDEHAVGH